MTKRRKYKGTRASAKRKHEIRNNAVSSVKEAGIASDKEGLRSETDMMESITEDIGIYDQKAGEKSKAETEAITEEKVKGSGDNIEEESEEEIEASGFEYEELFDKNTEASEENIVEEGEAKVEEKAVEEPEAKAEETTVKEPEAKAEDKTVEESEAKAEKNFLKKAWSKKWVRVLSTILIIIMIIIAAAYNIRPLKLIAMMRADRSDKSQTVQTQTQLTDEDEKTTAKSIEANKNDDISVQSAAQEKKDAERKVVHVYRNFALFGLDTRTGDLDKGTRSDSIMVLSLDQTTGEVKIVSVYRDTYLKFGNSMYNKANAAYAYGGPEMAVQMLEENLDIKIDEYVSVGFGALTDTIDLFGGVNIDVQENEIKHLNDYAKIMAKQLKKEYVPVEEAGYQTLDGIQATAYCRIRYTSGDDYKRTERQRTVLEAIAAQAQEANLVDLTRMVLAIVPEIKTSLSYGEIMSLLGVLPDVEVAGTDGFPHKDLRAEKTLSGAGASIIPDTLADNDVWLHEFFYGNSDYEPSEEVLEISDAISARSGGRRYQSAVTTDAGTTGSSYSQNSYSGVTAGDNTPSGDVNNYYVDPVTGVVMDSVTGQMITDGSVYGDPATGNVIDAQTGLPVTDESAAQGSAAGEAASSSSGSVISDQTSGNSQLQAAPVQEAVTTQPVITDQTAAAAQAAQAADNAQQSTAEEPVSSIQAGAQSAAADTYSQQIQNGASQEEAMAAAQAAANAYVLATPAQ